MCGLSNFLSGCPLRVDVSVACGAGLAVVLDVCERLRDSRNMYVMGFVSGETPVVPVAFPPGSRLASSTGRAWLHLSPIFPLFRLLG
jgi:hypothetical protein